jgi:hypothetical protein
VSRRGRKRNTTARRYPSGDAVAPTEAEREKDILALGLEARMRLFGLSPTKASHPAAGTAFGRAYLAGELHPFDSAHNQSLFDAGLEFERRRRAYRRAIHAMRLASAGDLDRQSGCGPSFGDTESPELVEASQRAMRSYAELRTAILECGDPLAMLALECWILEDRRMHIGPLRLGLNAIWRIVHMSRQRHTIAA